MNRERTAVGWLLGVLLAVLIGSGVGTSVAAAGPSAARAWLPLAERIPGRSATEVDSIRASKPPPLLVDRYGFGLTSRYPAPGALPGNPRSVPCATAFYSRVFFPALGWTAAIGYGRRSGSPGNDPTFHQPNGERVEMVPLELGLRISEEQPGRFGWRAEFSALVMWLRWTEPLPYLTPPDFGAPGGTRREYREWAAGGRFATGPEFRLPWHRLWLNLDGGLELIGVDRRDKGWSGGGGLATWRLTLGRER